MRTVSASLVLLLAACGGSGAGSESCHLQTEVSGAVTWQSGGSSPACLIPFGGTAGISMVFRPIEGEVAAFSVDVRDVKEGQTGSFAAKVEVELRDRRKWTTATTACSVSITEHTFEKQDSFRKQYQTAGRGECSTPATATEGAVSSVTVAPFTFRFPANW